LNAELTVEPDAGFGSGIWFWNLVLEFDFGLILIWPKPDRVSLVRGWRVDL